MITPRTPDSAPVLVTGATGYVASRLTPLLLDAGFDVRVMSRHPHVVTDRHPDVEAVASDLTDQPSLERALDGIGVAYYLVHSMAGKGFEAKDRKAATMFARAAAATGVRRIVYLGALGREEDSLSPHLSSRQEVGRLLAQSGLEVVELRAAIVVGCGSAGFDMLRHLTEKLPVMIAPRWLFTRIQPVAESDLMAYLVKAANSDVSGHQVIEIGGRDVLTYRDMILGYARVRGLRRRVMSVPVLTPRLSSYWVRLVTPISSSIARPLIDGLKNEVVVWDHSATRMFEEITPRSYQQAVGEALQSQVEQLERPSPSAPDVEPAPGSLDGIFCDRHWVACSAPPERLEAVVASIGGDAHWYPLRWAWRLRARFDDLFGGAGLTWRRPEEGLHRGSKVDWWTVEEVTHDRLLLRADMRVPGEAWLEWRVNPVGARCELRQSAYFRPKGLLGLMYWYGLYAFHQPIFKLMAVRLARRAETPRAPRGWATWWWWTAQRRSGHDAQRSAKAHDVGSN